MWHGLTTKEHVLKHFPPCTLILSPFPRSCHPAMPFQAGHKSCAITCITAAAKELPSTGHAAKLFPVSAAATQGHREQQDPVPWHCCTESSTPTSTQPSVPPLLLLRIPAARNCSASLQQVLSWLQSSHLKADAVSQQIKYFS